jgi:hypothetical protein
LRRERLSEAGCCGERGGVRLVVAEREAE